MFLVNHFKSTVSLFSWMPSYRRLANVTSWLPKIFNNRWTRANAKKNLSKNPFQLLKEKQTDWQTRLRRPGQFWNKACNFERPALDNLKSHFLDKHEKAFFRWHFWFSVYRTFLEQAERSKRMTEHELADCRDQLNDSQATILVGLIIPNCN